MNIVELSERDHAQANPKIVLRDTLGVLAVHILEKRYDIEDMPVDEILDKLLGIIEELQEVYKKKSSKV